MYKKILFVICTSLSLLALFSSCILPGITEVRIENHLGYGWTIEALWVYEQGSPYYGSGEIDNPIGYLSSTSVYLSPGSYTIEAYVYDGSSYYTAYKDITCGENTALIVAYIDQGDI